MTSIQEGQLAVTESVAPAVDPATTEPIQEALVKEVTKEAEEEVSATVTITTGAAEAVVIEEDPVSDASNSSAVTETTTATTASSSDLVDSAGESKERQKTEKESSVMSRKNSGAKPAIPARTATSSGRTQLSKSSSKPAADSSPSKTTGTGKASATSSAPVKNGRSSSAVVGRSRTVDLGKVAKKSDPPRVVRQMSTGALPINSTSSQAKVVANSNNKAAPVKPIIRLKPESPSKRSAVSSAAKNADEGKKSVKIGALFSFFFLYLGWLN